MKLILADSKTSQLTPLWRISFLAPLRGLFISPQYSVISDQHVERIYGVDDENLFTITHAFIMKHNEMSNENPKSQ